MKSFTGFLIGAVILALAGAALLGAARLERHLADAHEQAATLRYAEAQDSLAAAEEYAAYASWIPGVGEPTLKEIRARQAAIQYWRKDYDAVLPERTEPVALVDETNVDLQLVVANAAFRVGYAQAKDRATMIQALDEAASGYMTVLKNNTWHPDAAYNYEYVIRLRDELARNRRLAIPEEKPDGDLGEEGEPSAATSSEGFEIYIPLESDEKAPEGGDAGKASTKDRKG